jgi:MFS family permease
MLYSRQLSRLPTPRIRTRSHERSHWSQQPISQEFNYPDAKLQDIINSIYDIGYAAVALFTFFFDERFGHKNMIIAGGTMMIIRAILLGSSTSPAQLLVGRIVPGIGNGLQ